MHSSVHPLQRLLRPLAVAVFTVLLLALALQIALAQSGSKQVGLVVTYADGRNYTEVVTVPLTGTAYDVLTSAHVPVIVQQFSFGPAICKIADTGCSYPTQDCFCSPTNYWAFWTQTTVSSTGELTWTVSAVGSNAVTPAEREVIGFSWTPFDNSLRPPLLTFEQVAGPQPTATTTPSATPSPTSAPPPPGVPEPSTWLLLATGLGGLGTYARLRLRGKVKDQG